MADSGAGWALAQSPLCPPQSPFEAPTKPPARFYGVVQYRGIGRATEPAQGHTKCLPCSERFRKARTPKFGYIEGFSAVKLTRLEKAWQAWTKRLSEVDEWPPSEERSEKRVTPTDAISMLVRACDRASSKSTHWKCVEYINYLAETYNVKPAEWSGGATIGPSVVIEAAVLACQEIARPERRYLGPHYNFEKRDDETSLEAQERSAQERKEWKTLLSRLMRLYEWMQAK